MSFTGSGCFGVPQQWFSRCASSLDVTIVLKGVSLVGLDGFEPSTSRLSVVQKTLQVLSFKHLHLAHPRTSPHKSALSAPYTHPAEQVK